MPLPRARGVWRVAVARVQALVWGRASPPAIPTSSSLYSPIRCTPRARRLEVVPAKSKSSRTQSRFSVCVASPKRIQKNNALYSNFV
jgi:hypothetical protein